MKEFFAIKTPLNFLRLEGEVNTTLSFIDSEINVIDDVLIGRMPAWNVVSEHIVETFLISREFKDINSSLLFPVNSIEFDTSLIFVENITGPIISNYNNWFIQKESEWLIGRFNVWFEANRVCKKNFRYPTSRDFNDFIKWVDDNKYRTRKEVIDNFDYKNFW